MENIFCFDDVTVNTFTVSKPAWVRLSLSTPWEFFKLTELVPRFRLSVQLGSLKFNQQYCSSSLLTKSTYCINLCKLITRYASNLNLMNTKSHIELRRTWIIQTVCGKTYAYKREEKILRLHPVKCSIHTKYTGCTYYYWPLFCSINMLFK